MKTLLLPLASVILMLSLAGCASLADKPEAAASYGPVPVDYEMQIARAMGVPKENLVFEPPRKAYRTDGLLWGGKVGWQGYAVRARRFESKVLTAILKPLTDVTGKSTNLVALFEQGKIVLLADWDRISANLHWAEEEQPAAATQKP
jgi:hypothetical protein